jgi:RNA recognition motif-containing protein
LANQFGALESVKMVPNKSCAFVNFLYEVHAKEFYDKHCETPLQLGATPLRVGWAKASPLTEELIGAVRAGATRNLFIGNLAPTVMDEHLVVAFAKFGDIENIVRVPPKNMAFVNMTDIKHALSAKAALDGLELGGRPIKVNFAKEGANTRPPTFLAAGPSLAAQAQQQAAMAAAVGGAYPQSYMPQAMTFASPSTSSPSTVNGTSGVPASMMAGLPGAPEALSRGLYIGNVPDGVTYHDICKVANRFGGLDSVKLVPSKSCAFFNFIDKEAAQAMYLTSQQTPIMMGNRQLRVNWAKSGPLGKDVQDAIIKQSASRCLFLGNISETTSEEMLRARFSAFGEFDSIVIMRSKGIAFVNMTSIKSAITAREQLNGNDLEGQLLKINFAKEGATRSMPSQMMMTSGGSMNNGASVSPSPMTGVIPHMGLSGHPVAYLPAVPPQLPPIPWTPPLPGTAEAAMLPTLPSVGITPSAAVAAMPVMDTEIAIEAPAVPLTPTPDAAPIVTVTPIVGSDSMVNIQLSVGSSAVPYGFEDFVESHEASRAVLVLGLSPDVAYHDICQLANRFGGLDSVRLSPSRQQVLITFFENSCALAMHTQFQNNQLLVRGQPLRVCWGRSTPLTSDQSTLVRAGASRNLWVGGVAEGVTEPMLYELFLPYGEFDSIVIMRQKNIAFVNLTSLTAAVAARQALQGAIMLGQPIKINFAKEAIRRAPV